MREPTLGHEAVGFDHGLHVRSVDSHSDAHQQMLGALDHLAVDAQQVGSLKRLYGTHQTRVNTLAIISTSVYCC